MTTNKIGVQHLANILYEKGLRTAILSPGSRNAPLTVAFNRHPGIECLSIIDERSAAFFALGMAQQSQKPVAIISTSGSAALNYAPAIAEAYYQQIPMLVITADRPTEFIDQAEGQSIRQKNIFSNYIKGSFELPQEIHSDNDQWYNDRMVSEAYNLATDQQMGPIHINAPLREPLYDDGNPSLSKTKIIGNEKTEQALPKPALQKLAEKWNSLPQIMILTGMLTPNMELNHVLNKVADINASIVLTETTSNLSGEKFFPCIDKVVASLVKREAADFAPDLLITFGNQVISKMVKSMLRENPPKEHWHIDPSGKAPDTFKGLTKVIPMKATRFFTDILPLLKEGDPAYFNLWKERDLQNEAKHQTYIEQVPFSDLKAMEKILQAIPEFSNLQMANSTSVRYVQLFRPFKQLSYNANRGTSGIDGCTSTAAGAAFESGVPTTLITGDIAFLYDSNALWNQHLPGNLKIIILNNSGGGIFRFIPGPSKLPELEEFFETRHNYRAEHLAKNFGVDYICCNEPNNLKHCLTKLYENSTKTTILEVMTPAEESAKVLKMYFKNLKNE